MKPEQEFLSYSSSFHREMSAWYARQAAFHQETSALYARQAVNFRNRRLLPAAMRVQNMARLHYNKSRKYLSQMEDAMANSDSRYKFIDWSFSEK